ncbi:transposase [Streptomyces sp. NPDC091376]|uniref:transposase n=1 Tax=Streptomyces sp. NPDC091376 TaxID=3365994 RepID=UPI0038161579
MRDRLDGLWRDEELATVCVLEFVLGLSDRQAAEAVRCRVDFKYGLAMELDDPGFHHNVLADFRDRLTEGGPRRPPPRPRPGPPEGGRPGTRAHHTAHRLRPGPGRSP